MNFLSKAVVGVIVSTAVVYSSLQAVSAAIINGTINGNVTNVQGDVPGVMVNSPVIGTYSYDDTIETNNFFGIVNPLTSFSLSIGANPKVFNFSDLASSVQFPPGRLIAQNFTNIDTLAFIFENAPIRDFLGTNSSANVGATISRSRTIPFQAFELISENQNVTFNFQAKPVPEPLTIAGSGLAFVGLAVLKNRYKKLQKSANRLSV